MTENRKPLVRAEPLALIAVGGFTGASLRYSVSLAFVGAFPWGTLAVNVLGSFLLGVVLYERHLVDAVSAETRLLVGTGFLSSFTTYSTFALQTAQLDPSLAALNVVANYALGLLAVLASRLVTRWVA